MKEHLIREQEAHYPKLIADLEAENRELRTALEVLANCEHGFWNLVDWLVAHDAPADGEDAYLWEQVARHALARGRQPEAVRAS